MAKGGRLRVDLFGEDRGHEQFGRPLVARLARETGVPIEIRVLSASGGHPRALQALRSFQKAVAAGVRRAPDLLVVIRDSNRESWKEVRAEVARIIEPSVFPRVVVACPEPYVERWCIADPEAFQRVVGVPPGRDPRSRDREAYKALLRVAVEKAGVVVLVDEMDLAPELVDAMDLYKAGKVQQSLKHYVDELRGALQSLKR
jgi:hypothetical protein